MTVYLALLVSGALLALLLTPLIAHASLALGLVDAPGGRKVHLTSVPRSGGLAVVLAAALALAGVIFTEQWTGIAAPRLGPLVPILLGTTLVFAVGLVDDFKTLPASPKLVVQIVAAAIVAASGLLIERLSLGGQTWQLGWWSYPVTLGWIVVLTNGFNLIDGIDGLATGIAVVAGATCAVILINRGHAAEAMVLAALVGAAIGFLVYNFSPASIFLGDGGSLVFGFVLATTAITGWQKGATALAAAVPLLIFALPLADAASTLTRRALRRPTAGRVTLAGVLRQIVEPDREHIHHRLMALGWSTRRIVLLLYAATVLFSAIALATASYD